MYQYDGENASEVATSPKSSILRIAIERKQSISSYVLNAMQIIPFYCQVL